MKFVKAVHSDIPVVAKLALQLWHDNTTEKLEKQFNQLLNNNQAAFYLALKDNEYIGFAQCSIRNDYVEGTKSSPVGYLEGIFVLPKYRKQGVAQQLIEICENWSREHGCHQFASDCELTNTDSFHFHLNSGFIETNRIICFVKNIE